MASKKTKAKSKAKASPAPVFAAPNPDAVLLGLAIFFLSIAIYIPAMTAGFIWDDDQLLTANPLIHDSAGLWKLWFAPTTADYFPLTSSTLWFEWRLWGWNGAGYHITNILLHGVVAVVTWRVLVALRVPGAWLAALIFGVHPVCVESVAWISERKNTLSQIFLLFTFLAYFRFERNGRNSTFVLAVCCFLLALLAKTSVVMLPFALLLYAWWQHGTITRRDLIRSIPFFIASAALGIVTIYFQYGRAIGSEVIPIGGAPSRIAKAGMAIWFYVSKTLAPFNLIAIYPTWKVTPPPWYEFLPDLGLVAVFVGCWRLRVHAWARAVLFGFGYFVVMILPAIGFLKMSYMRLTLVADHFQYISMIGVIALVVAAAMRWVPKVAWRPVATVAVLGLCVLSWAQASIYQSEETLWRDTLSKNEATWQGHNHMGAALYMKGERPAAFEHFKRAVELKPENPEVHNNLGLGYATFGQMDKAIEEYRRAISIKDDAAMRTNLGNALQQVKRFQEAIEQYREAIKMDANNVGAHTNLGLALASDGQVDEAMEQFRIVLQLDPNSQIARQSLTQLLQRKQGR
ncbi:MAG: hypothetical protein QOD99_2855 [Chthoniobacter sp.]|jgi:Tfp pilus assembly protein PilF|nr:hypothetical protein [Chthoniobacter sp.]